MSLAFRPIDFRGTCLCRSVRFEGVGLRDIVYCHCTQCRRFHGTAAAYTATLRSRLRFDADETLRWFASSEFARRAYCLECGSALFWLPQEKPYICIAAGTLNESLALRAVRHIYVADKAYYYEIDDQLPCFNGSMLAE